MYMYICMYIYMNDPRTWDHGALPSCPPACCLAGLPALLVARPPWSPVSLPSALLALASLLRPLFLSLGTVCCIIIILHNFDLQL